MKPGNLQKLIFLFLSSVVFYQPAAAQQATDKKHPKISRPEKWWAFTHPFVVHKAYKLTIKARDASREMMNDSLLDHDGNGGQVDAFRHAYWMALLSQNIAPRKAKQLGIAHEKGDYINFKKHRMEEGALPDSMAGVMDLYNNDAGIEIGKANKELTEEQLKQLVKQKVIAGEMKVLLKNANGQYRTCDSSVIDLSLYIHQWSIPKCLVSSDKIKEYRR